MRGFELELTSNGIIKRVIGNDEHVDNLVLEKARFVDDFLVADIINEGAECYFSISLPDMPTLRNYLTKPISKATLCRMCLAYTKALDPQSSGVPIDYVVNNLDYIFYDEVNNNLKFVLCAIRGTNQNEHGIKGFFRELISNAIYAESEDGNYVAKLLSMINSNDFSITKLKKYLHVELGSLNGDNEGDSEKYDAMRRQVSSPNVLTQGHHTSAQNTESAPIASQEKAVENTAPTVPQEKPDITPAQQMQNIGQKPNVMHETQKAQNTESAPTVPQEKPVENTASTVPQEKPVENTASTVPQEKPDITPAQQKQRLGIMQGAVPRMMSAMAQSNNMQFGNQQIKQNLNMNQPMPGHGTLVGQVGVRPTPHLVRKSTGEIINITKTNFSIGKSKARADYAIEDNSAISRIHCVIVQHDGVNYIVDNGSTNHTYLNGVELTPGKEELLKHKSNIYLGDEGFTFLLRKDG